MTVYNIKKIDKDNYEVVGLDPSTANCWSGETRVVEKFSSYDEARQKIRDMKHEIGFIDWTPDFIKVKVK